MNDLPYWEGLEFIHCIYFDNEIDVKRTNTKEVESSLFDQFKQTQKK